MMSKSNDLTVYILSHHRAGEVSTYDTLLCSGYTGKIFIVVDDEDDVQEYIRYYGEDTILVYCKDDYIDKYDAMDNFKKRSIAFYARNFINEHAYHSGVSYYCQFDDDITGLHHRYVDTDGKFKKKSILNLDDIFSSYIEFLSTDARMSGICFALDSGYFGGANGRFKDGMGRRMYQVMLFKTAGQVEWKGSHYEDFLLSALNFDRLYFDSYLNSFSSPKMSSNEGGIDYTSLFDATVYAKVALGENIILYPDGRILIRNNHIFPKIISSRFKNER